MENNQQKSTESVQPAAALQITPEAVSFLARTARWTKFLSITGFIMTGLLIFAGVVVVAFSGSFSTMVENTGTISFFNTGYIGMIYIVIAIIWIGPVIYLNNFSNAMTRAVRNGTTERLTNAMLNLKRFFKYIGLLMIVLLVIYVLVVVSALGAGLYILSN